MKGKTTNKKQLIRIIVCAMAMLLFVGLLASCDKAGPQGEPGAPGQDGKSAYELAVENGYTGTVEEWLASLVGEVGATGESGSPGINGKSAYEIAVEKGYQGTEEEWLASLIGPAGKDGANGQDGANGKDGINGKDGTNGKSAYELAVENGFKGSLTEWLDSLVGEEGKNGENGKDGTNGKSAYELAVENGFKGSLTEWLASLVGKDGAAAEKGEDGKDGVDGKSAYELAVENGYKGDVQSWLASLVGKDGTNGSDGKNGLSAYEVAVKNGYKGSESDWIASLVGAKGEKGDKGDTGPAGADGKDGADGITPLLRINTDTNMWEVSCDNGKTWKSLNVPATGEDGQDGADGQKGDKGDKGDPGAPGADGEDGQKGDKGDKGDKGETGAAGQDGKDGVDGSDGKDGVSITNAYVDDDMHLWIELSNGNKIDAGYVGVEVAPTYTVTFVDYNNAILKKVTDVKTGASVTAPADPIREGFVFVGWDVDFSNITSDLVVTAKYEAAYTGTCFVGSNLTVTAGSTGVSYSISVKNNPGILGMLLSIEYDESVFVLTATSNGNATGNLTYQKPSKLVSGCNFVWYGTETGEVIDGTVLNLVFTVRSDAPAGSYPIKISYSEADSYDGGYNTIPATVVDGTITVK